MSLFLLVFDLKPVSNGPLRRVFSFLCFFLLSRESLTDKPHTRESVHFVSSLLSFWSNFTQALACIGRDNFFDRQC